MRFPQMFMALVAMLLMTAGCSSYQNVPPNDIGMMLTPTGYGEKIYTPGQVDVGTTDSGNQMNRLVLIQRSGVDVMEPFVGKESSPDKEDHRCLLGDKSPLTLDVRLLLALPNYETPEGKKDLARVFLLGNPKEVAGTSDRVLRISAETIYVEQAQQSVRGKIRQICASYKNFDAIFASMARDGDDDLVKRIEHAVATVLKERNVPLHLVNAYSSNLKPDPTVIEAIATLQAAQKRTEAIGAITAFLDADKTGSRLLVYQMQTWKEIVAIGNANGHNTIFFSPNAAGIVPLPAGGQHGRPATAPAAAPAEKE